MVSSGDVYKCGEYVVSCDDAYKCVVMLINVEST